jgi:hypothetical protein
VSCEEDGLTQPAQAGDDIPGGVDRCRCRHHDECRHRPCTCEHDDRHDHDRDCQDDRDDQRKAAKGTVTDKVVALRYDHFGDFEGFVVEDDRESHVVLTSSERRVEDVARRAWRQRLQVRATRLDDGGLERLAISGHPDDDG